MLPARVGAFLLPRSHGSHPSIASMHTPAVSQAVPVPILAVPVPIAAISVHAPTVPCVHQPPLCMPGLPCVHTPAISMQTKLSPRRCQPSPCRCHLSPYRCQLSLGTCHFPAIPMSHVTISMQMPTGPWTPAAVPTHMSLSPRTCHYPHAHATVPMHVLHPTLSGYSKAKFGLTGSAAVC